MFSLLQGATYKYISRIGGIIRCLVIFSKFNSFHSFIDNILIPDHQPGMECGVWWNYKMAVLRDTSTEIILQVVHWTVLGDTITGISLQVVQAVYTPGSFG